MISNNEYDALLNLLCAELKNQKSELVISNEAILNLSSLAKKQALHPIIATQLLRYDMLDKQDRAMLTRVQLMAVHRYEQLVLVEKAVCAILDEFQIPYVLLKGALISQYYPQPWMRTRSDIDILVQEINIEKALEALVNRLGYSIIVRDYHDVALRSKNGMLLELHFSLLERDEKLDKVLSKVWEYTTPVNNGSYRYEMSGEFFAFHQLAHMAYHFLNGGCGIRFLIDLWLVHQNHPFDHTKLKTLCDESDIFSFYENMLKVCGYLFEDKSPEPLVLQILEFLFSGSVFGARNNLIAVNQNRAGGKNKYFFYRIWWSYDDLKEQYPGLRGKKLLLPFYQVRRWLRLLRPGKIKQYAKELKINSEMNPREVADIAEFIKNVGL